MGADMTEQKQDMDVKDAFIGMVSHEIKTPLTVIIGALSTVRTARLDSKEASGLMSDAITSADILNGIVDNMLEISRSQSRRLALNKAQVDVAVVVRGAVDKLRSRSDIHDLVVDIRGSLPPVFVDRARLERVLNNLIDNAIKYSPKGGEVRVTARQENGQLVVSVIDHGIGISAEDQGRLFRSFERIDNQAAGPTPGVGLGLNVCRILVESHGGKIWVESEPGKGSTFTFSVPLGKR
jgi:signal transduction histidine kinase